MVSFQVLNNNALFGVKYALFEDATGRRSIIGDFLVGSLGVELSSMALCSSAERDKRARRR